ncbi:MAG: hypothetical protein H0U73_06875 [Tatlockia sp.]|nr:hypothetical protein [Tatlockia sp.]
MIRNVKTFPHHYRIIDSPLIVQNRKKESETLNSSNTFFGRTRSDTTLCFNNSETIPVIKKRNSNSSFISEFSLAKKEEKRSILLNDLVMFNKDLKSETTAYNKLIHKRKKQEKETIKETTLELEAHYIKTKKCSICPDDILMKIEQLKADLLQNIARLLKLINSSYLIFCQESSLSLEAHKEISNYFCKAIMQTMSNGEFRKAPSEFQNLKKKQDDRLFESNLDCFDFFNKQSFDLRIQALTFNWLILYDANLDIKLSKAKIMNADTKESFNKFRCHLQDPTKVKLEPHLKQISKINKILLKLISVEQEQQASNQYYEKAWLEDARFQIYKKIEATKEVAISQSSVENTGASSQNNEYYSFKALLLTFLKKSPMKKMYYDMHLQLQEKMATDLLATVVRTLSDPIKLNHQELAPYMAKVTFFETDLYLHVDWKNKINLCLEAISAKKEFKDKIANLDLGNESIVKLIDFVGKKINLYFEFLLLGNPSSFSAKISRNSSSQSTLSTQI